MDKYKKKSQFKKDGLEENLTIISSIIQTRNDIRCLKMKQKNLMEKIFKIIIRIGAKFGEYELTHCP